MQYKIERNCIAYTVYCIISMSITEADVHPDAISPENLAAVPKYQLEHGHACIFGQAFLSGRLVDQALGRTAIRGALREKMECTSICGADHGEVRNGGFPDCFLQKVRKDDLQGTDPVFMFYMQRTSLIMLSMKDSKIFRRYNDRDSRS
jgi:hypothetical protein